jgi:hypothetical protein
LKNFQTRFALDQSNVMLLASWIEGLGNTFSWVNSRAFHGFNELQ